ncbi:MAG TPA: hypothetical protein VIX87_12290 [Steroidobacteraceae bacterium]
MKPLIATAVVAALAAMRVARLLAGIIGLQYALGTACALISAAVLILWRFTPPIRIGAFVAAVYLWHWPWFAGLLFAAPRLVLVLPGLFATVRSRIRHPRPLWRGLPTA